MGGSVGWEVFLGLPVPAELLVVAVKREARAMSAEERLGRGRLLKRERERRRDSLSRTHEQYCRRERIGSYIGNREHFQCEMNTASRQTQSASKQYCM